jgi:hypothetical protein
MNIGSIIVCVKPTEWRDSMEKYGFFVECPVVKSLYTVRGFWKSPIGGGLSVYLEEIKNDQVVIEGFKLPEPSFHVDCFREVLPPMNILEKIEENIEERELIVK